MMLWPTAVTGSKRSVAFLRFRVPEGDIGLRRAINRFPYVPAEPRARDERCFEA